MSSPHLPSGGTRGKKIANWLPLGVFAVYAALPTKNYYWDGVSFALNIEQAGRIGSPSFWRNLIHPNHLLYNVIGYFAWTLLHSVGLRVRALTVLQAVNMVLAALTVLILQRTLLRLTQSAYLSVAASALFAFSAVYWRFATDADAYIPSVLLLVAAFHVLNLAEKPGPLVLGLLHAGAMLIHQLAIFFFPAAAIGIYLKAGRRGLLQYSALATATTAGVYYASYRLQQQSALGNAGGLEAVGLNTSGPQTFLHWLTFHSADSAFTFSILKSLTTTLANYPRLFFGGTAHLLRFFGPFMLITILLLAAVVSALTIRIIRYPVQFRVNLKPTLPLTVAVIWLVTYAVFLFFWLPWNTFYKLFCLPAIIVIFAGFLARYEGPRRYRLVLFVATMVLANLAFYIFPYSRPDYNQGVRFALRMQPLWSGRTIVYYSDFMVDDWYIRYFNPQTTWKPLNPANGAESFAQEAGREIETGHDIWLDTTAAEALMQNSPAMAAHFYAEQEDTVPHRHTIRFYRWRMESP